MIRSAVGRFAAIALGLVLLAWIVAVAWLGFNQRAYIYYPDRRVVEPAAAGAPGFQRVQIDTADSEHLVGWWKAPAPGSGVVLYLHGNAGNLAGRAPRLHDLADSGLGVLAIDWRGYGGSTGKPTEAGLNRDAEAALNWILARQSRSHPVAVFGESLGTGLAVQLAARRREVGGILLDSPYASMTRLAELGQPWAPVRWLILDRYDSEAAIKRVHAPVLILHCDQDAVIPLTEGQRLYAAALQPKAMRVLHGCGHVRTWQGEARTEALASLRDWTTPEEVSNTPANPR